MKQQQFFNPPAMIREASGHSGCLVQPLVTANQARGQRLRADVGPRAQDRTPLPAASVGLSEDLTHGGDVRFPSLGTEQDRLRTLVE
jgi:hypothetical protein